MNEEIEPQYVFAYRDDKSVYKLCENGDIGYPPNLTLSNLQISDLEGHLRTFPNKQPVGSTVYLRTLCGVCRKPFYRSLNELKTFSTQEHISLMKHYQNEHNLKL